jgi:hypothetical protein
METTTDPRFPIGRLQRVPALDAAGRAEAIEHIAGLPALLGPAVRDLSDEQLDTPYREGGWTVRQLVHHLADSHMNAFLRFKLVVTEDNPPLKGYDQNAWADAVDGRTLPIAPSLAILEGMHERWAEFLRSLGPEAFARPGLHSENGAITLDTLLQIYSWHGRHHVAHITELRKRQGW